jgi:hypothetical protein
MNYFIEFTGLSLTSGHARLLSAMSIMRRFAAGTGRALPLQCRGRDGEMQATPTGFAKQPEGLDFHNEYSE